MTIFNNWDVVAQGWYIACASRSLPREQARSVELCGQRLVVFRGVDGRVRALDAYCPHMGTDLGIGRVEGNQIRCFFHHWAFDETGQCQNIPCGEGIPPQAQVRAYAVTEQYGFIWVYPDQVAPEGLAEFDELRGHPIVCQADRAFERNCHHHICMMNGIDAQHLQTVHRLHVQMNLSLQQNQTGTIVDFTLHGQFPATTWREKMGRQVLGPTYTYAMRYAHGCLGLLTVMKNVRLVPPLHMIYAYTPVAPGRTRIQPIYVTRQRQGLGGWLVSQLLLGLTRLAYYLLRDEDGLIYDHIQFSPQALLPIDRPIVAYMQYVNRLEPSIWSRVPPRSAADRTQIPVNGQP
ncbi:Rieske (2Fe-2S) protein [Leptolyngbya sp. 'hensonii']|uniref:aromatic ring-hydroxylating oxygenase subunit alpha n=1 Tax=Leptolyngbya sp. 'hensonii' TaxID=1922337 RepID=UPI00094FC797|nr:aromatic ring-hydroxylating dioxygenase subunit alpha [Leptolyngbya sp. 'hensonii']OLP17093.1 Rieske (2Fe-2S) protein [Leptolyngbya sp. 'hensonii']